MQRERTFCKPPVFWVLVQIDFENTAAWILEEKLPNLPNLPKYTNGFLGNVRESECEHGS
jgi:hypothetical protein